MAPTVAQRLIVPRWILCIRSILPNRSRSRTTSPASKKGPTLMDFFGMTKKPADGCNALFVPMLDPI
jgi:hypothetical protein